MTSSNEEKIRLFFQTECFQLRFEGKQCELLTYLMFQTLIAFHEKQQLKEINVLSYKPCN